MCIGVCVCMCALVYVCICVCGGVCLECEDCRKGVWFSVFAACRCAWVRHTESIHARSCKKDHHYVQRLLIAQTIAQAVVFGCTQCNDSVTAVMQGVPFFSLFCGSK